jgi:hypothetical protein
MIQSHSISGTYLLRKTLFRHLINFIILFISPQKMQICTYMSFMYIYVIYVHICTYIGDFDWKYSYLCTVTLVCWPQQSKKVTRPHCSVFISLRDKKDFIENPRKSKNGFGRTTFDFPIFFQIGSCDVTDRYAMPTTFPRSASLNAHKWKWLFWKVFQPLIKYLRKQHLLIDTRLPDFLTQHTKTG